MTFPRASRFADGITVVRPIAPVEKLRGAPVRASLSLSSALYAVHSGPSSIWLSLMTRPHVSQTISPRA